MLLARRARLARGEGLGRKGWQFASPGVAWFGVVSGVVSCGSVWRGVWRGVVCDVVRV